METTSGRGVMNSRTRLSLNSTTCSIIWASESSNDESKSDEPTSRRTHEQKIRNELRKQQNFHEDVDQSLRQSIPRSGNENDHAAGGFGRNNYHPKIRQ